jgi:predicted Zn-dependent peptidase
VLAGSRHETDGEWGVAHFMEHVTFKGTRRCPTRAPCRGGRGLRRHVQRRDRPRVDRLLGAAAGARGRARLRRPRRAVVRPLLRAADIERERDIVVEEIRSYRDDPAQYVFNLFDEAFFGDTPLGREIAGSEDSVRACRAAGARFWSRAYRPSNAG